MFIENSNSKKSIWNAPACNQQKQTRQAKAHKYDHISTLSIPIICSITKEKNNFVIHKSIFFCWKHRNLSKRPKISWKMKKQKRSMCIIVISITITLWKRFYTCCLEVGIFQVFLMEAIRSVLDVSSKLMYHRFFWWKRLFTLDNSSKLVYPCFFCWVWVNFIPRSQI